MAELAWLGYSTSSFSIHHGCIDILASLSQSHRERTRSEDPEMSSYAAPSPNRLAGVNRVLVAKHQQWWQTMPHAMLTSETGTSEEGEEGCVTSTQ